MRFYLFHCPATRGSFSPEELDMLDALVSRVTNSLGITDISERNETAARILSLYTLGGRSVEEIGDLAIRLHKQGYTPGGRRSDTPPPKRLRTERQRRWAARSQE